MAGEDGAYRQLYPLRALHGALPLWAEYPGAAAPELRGLQDFFVSLRAGLAADDKTVRERDKFFKKI